MSTFQVAFDPETWVATVQAENDLPPDGSVLIGEFEHPDEIYPDSVVMFHGVRDLLYKRSAADPENTAMFPNNITDMSKVTIELDVDYTAVTGVSLEPATDEIAALATTQLTATVAPEGATNQAVTYSSSNEAVATVDEEGLVTGVAAGEATITVTTVEGEFTDTSVITVTA